MLGKYIVLVITIALIIMLAIVQKKILERKDQKKVVEGRVLCLQTIPGRPNTYRCEVAVDSKSVWVTTLDSKIRKYQINEKIYLAYVEGKEKYFWNDEKVSPLVIVKIALTIVICFCALLMMFFVFI